jgi:hypothetical protein
MGLDAHVRCACIRDGLAKSHPFPDRLTLDETAEPVLTGDPSEEDWLVHDRWFADSCEHSGYLLSERLGNISMASHLREFLRPLEGHPRPRFPILLEKVLYDGTHSGDWIPSERTVDLLKEVETVLHSKDILADSEKEFFLSMKKLCRASIETGNPIVF